VAAGAGAACGLWFCCFCSCSGTSCISGCCSVGGVCFGAGLVSVFRGGSVWRLPDRTYARGGQPRVMGSLAAGDSRLGFGERTLQIRWSAGRCRARWVGCKGLGGWKPTPCRCQWLAGAAFGRSGTGLRGALRQRAPRVSAGVGSSATTAHTHIDREAGGTACAG
jgi:hypothetical protein